MPVYKTRCALPSGDFDLASFLSSCKREVERRRHSHSQYSILYPVTQGTIPSMDFDINKLLVEPNKKLVLRRHDPSDKTDLPSTKQARNEWVKSVSHELGELQERLFAEKERKFLILLQGMDTAGKDGTIRKVFQAVNPLGIRVAYFNAPSDNELDRDYLWRVHHVVPRKGEMVIFNRSHYEDVLTVPVHGWISPEEEEKRYRHIVEFERLLTDTGTTIVKFFLHISKDEQRKRLQERIDKKEKNWKFNPSDLSDRKLWDKFYNQYEKVLERTSTDNAPWFVIPANSKSSRNCYIINILIEQLKAMNIKIPTVDTSNWPKQIE